MKPIKVNSLTGYPDPNGVEIWITNATEASDLNLRCTPLSCKYEYVYCNS